jgi:hypothetical protein
VTDLDPWSPNNPIRRLASGGSPLSIVLYANPAYLAEMGYAAEAQAWENGCSLWTVAQRGGLAALGLATLAGPGGIDAIAGVGRGLLERYGLIETQLGSTTVGRVAKATLEADKTWVKPGMSEPLANVIRAGAGIREFLKVALPKDGAYLTWIRQLMRGGR